MKAEIAKLLKLEKNLMPDASLKLVVKETAKILGDDQEYKYLLQQNAELGFNVEMASKNSSFNLSTKFDIWNFFNKDIVQKGNVVVVGFGYKKKVGKNKNWTIEATFDLNL
jgi:hypothetical protein